MINSDDLANAVPVIDTRQKMQPPPEPRFHTGKYVSQCVYDRRSPGRVIAFCPEIEYAAMIVRALNEMEKR